MFWGSNSKKFRESGSSLWKSHTETKRNSIFWIMSEFARKNVRNFWSNFLNVKNRKKSDYNKKFRGLCISKDGKCDGIKKSRYVNGLINNFKTILGNYREENLCDGINTLFNKFSVENSNVFIYTYFHKNVNGPVIFIKIDRTSLFEFKNWCSLITCNLKVHKHLLCNLCKIQY